MARLRLLLVIVITILCVLATATTQAETRQWPGVAPCDTTLQASGRTCPAPSSGTLVQYAG